MHGAVCVPTCRVSDELAVTCYLFILEVNMKSEVSERDSVIRRRMFITDRLLQMKKGPHRPAPSTHCPELGP